MEITGIHAELQALRSLIGAVVAHIVRERVAHPDVEDAVSETLRRALEGQHRLKPGQPLRPWVLGIARHVALDLLRERQRSARCRAELPARSDGSSPRAALDLVADPSPGADVRLDDARRLAEAERAIAELGESQRRALMMFHLEGLGYREIAARLGVPVGTVGTWIARARKSVLASVSQGESRS